MADESTTARARSVEGILVVDKPAGLTSHEVVERVRRLVGLRRVGHTGTLDPFATGVMVLCLGRGTRVARYFEGLGKAYRAVLKLGVETDTGDRDGEVMELRAVPELEAEEVESVLEGFRGTIAQRAPAFSALKVAGERLYAKARRGEKVSGPVRRVTIETLRLESLEADEMTLFVECSKGTYIRSLAGDVGQQLGCGAHCLSLVRTRVGPFSIEEALALGELEELGGEGAAEKVLGLGQALGRFMEPVSLTSRGAALVSHGNSVGSEAVYKAPEVVRPGETYMALGADGKLIALVEARTGARGTSWVPSRVLAEPI